MFIDASAMLAILNEEPEGAEVIVALSAAATPLCTTSLGLFEAALGLAKSRAPGGKSPAQHDVMLALDIVEAFLQETGATILAVTPDIGPLAVQAAARFGKAVGHKAALNFGDCFVYAAAMKEKLPLLFIGMDFPETDITSALPDPRPVQLR